MQIRLHQAGKRFNRHWIFRNLSYQFSAPNHYAITGSNGSGKSTLLQMLAGILAPVKGTVEYDLNGAKIEVENVYRHISFCSPAMELPEELTLNEFLQFHFSQKPKQDNIDLKLVLRDINLSNAADRSINEFSSGMKQRVKLLQAFCAATPVLLLDEPTSNLDAEGIALYHYWIRTYTANRLCIIASNDENEIAHIHNRITMSDYKHE